MQGVGLCLGGGVECYQARRDVTAWATGWHRVTSLASCDWQTVDVVFRRDPPHDDDVEEAVLREGKSAFQSADCSTGARECEECADPTLLTPLARPQPAQQLCCCEGPLTHKR